MPEAHRSGATSKAPWIATAIAGAVLIALVVVYFAVLLPDRRNGTTGASGTTGQFSYAEQAAMTAATTELDNVGSLGKSNFTAAFQRALNGATGSFKKDLLADRKQAQKVLRTRGVTAEVTHRALVGPADRTTPSYVVLMTFTGSQSSVTSLLLAPQQVAVTVVNKAGKWLVSDVRSVGVT
jgi:hypothetical protein